jgi:hypothetical protein
VAKTAVWATPTRNLGFPIRSFFTSVYWIAGWYLRVDVREPSDELLEKVPRHRLVHSLRLGLLRRRAQNRQQLPNR